MGYAGVESFSETSQQVLCKDGSTQLSINHREVSQVSLFKVRVCGPVITLASKVKLVPKHYISLYCES